ncbi:uncharacterized protein LOC125068333 [Vanessa atalanta]|uniref:uncharacterized protein LOC125068333 n=1 Tax=Vanessa atalanta TaxID=42275 RepID=UPI001FCE18F8|nr:uncharacterized protein LOC125068333 [Vanessa atalanta]
MAKCDKCNKYITKNKPGLECSRCEKVVHLNTICSELSNKQLSAVRAAENLEWTCRECHENSPKRHSIVIPDDDEEEEDKRNEAPDLKIDMQQLLVDITRQMEKTIKREMKELSQSLQFHSEKMDEVITMLEACQETIKDLKKKNIELINKNNNLETRVGALEQRLQEKEQRELSNCVEICNVPQRVDENTYLLAKQVAKKLNQQAEDIKEAIRLPGKKENPSPILIKLKNEQLQNSWLTSAKSSCHKIKAVDIVPETTDKIEIEKSIYLRETLTPYNRHLLWFAKKELSTTYKFIWIKKGILRARKEGDKEKAIIIRSKEDVNKLK